MRDPFELAIYLTKDEEEWEQAIQDRYGIDYVGFSHLISDLMPLIDVGESPLTKKLYKGFADSERQIWLEKIEVK